MTATVELLLPSAADGAADGIRPISPAGVIGAAVIKAARRSARLTRRAPRPGGGGQPGHRAQVGERHLPLYCVGYQQLRQLAEALASGGASSGRMSRSLRRSCAVRSADHRHARAGSRTTPKSRPSRTPASAGTGSRTPPLGPAGITPDRFRSVADRGRSWRRPM